MYQKAHRSLETTQRTLYWFSPVVCLGTGKHQFCGDIFDKTDATSPWVMVSSEVLATNAQRETETRKALALGHRVILDHCILSADERRCWVHIANKYWPYHSRGMDAAVFCVWFHQPLNVCVSRCMAKKKRPFTHREEAYQKISCMAKTMTEPSTSDGFDAVVKFRNVNNEGFFYTQLVAKLSTIR